MEGDWWAGFEVVRCERAGLFSPEDAGGGAWRREEGGGRTEVSQAEQVPPVPPPALALG